MSDFNIDDYATVAERIAEFYEKFPTGALRRIGEPVPWQFGNKDFIAYTAGAWRDAANTGDPDGIGTAWEPVPGPTQFTKDSELMNAETAAWGRAIIACGAATASKGIASAEEVENRTTGKQRGPDYTAAAKAATSAIGKEWPTCAAHGDTLTAKKTKAGKWMVSCSQKMDDGSYCSSKPYWQESLPAPVIASLKAADNPPAPKPPAADEDVVDVDPDAIPF